MSKPSTAAERPAKVAVVDYGAGNLRSVAKALERSGLEVTVTDDPAVVRSADGVVLPGVGGALDVVIPVYKGLDYTAACIRSVLEAENERPVEAVVVNDCSPDEEIAALLEMLAESGHITLLTNEENLGFVESVNRGMALHPDRDAVILHSDAVVANDWLDRLAWHAQREPGTGILQYLHDAQVDILANGTKLIPAGCADVDPDLHIQGVVTETRKPHPGLFISDPGVC